MNRHYRALRDDVSNFGWVYGNLIYDERINPRIQVGNAMLFSTCIKGTESQYTGLKDSKGNEIYEGDIVKAKWSRASTGGYFQSDDAYCDTELTLTVKFVENGFYYVRIDGKRASIPKDAQITVIGNIHQHPDLII
jgi:uncharacterized phage protein (TIGR01671 family)